jgi:hypothetical protein
MDDCLQMSNRFSRREDRDNNMATEGRRYAGKKSPELMVKRQCKLLRWWLRPAENLNRPEKRVQVCEPETGRNLSDVRMKWDRMKISSTARRAERKFPISRWAKS